MESAKAVGTASFGDRAGVLFAGQEEAGALVEQLLFLHSGGFAGSTEGISHANSRRSRPSFPVRFCGFTEPFDARGLSDGLKDAVMAFVKRI
ncbi:MAG: hypothetical protein ACLR0U_16730 [Enterocloster clostridioformis]